jgi:hypothetical protein
VAPIPTRLSPRGPRRHGALDGQGHLGDGVPGRPSEVGAAADGGYGGAPEHTGKGENLLENTGGGGELWQHCSPGKVAPRPDGGDTRRRGRTRGNGSVARALPRRGSASAPANDEEQMVRDPGDGGAGWRQKNRGGDSPGEELGRRWVWPTERFEKRSRGVRL